ncbi:hypothetical protein TorRG33x02_266780 [Trema orientale]|uniref:Uncharacterized protein n=1 Tax=Trema orientale TaxID=63057 RepID=A0A2P5D0L1_TREOI|nr:hypothetical protein TorRG33x02_266780 [Trema orientale]
MGRPNSYLKTDRSTKKLESKSQRIESKPEKFGRRRRREKRTIWRLSCGDGRDDICVHKEQSTRAPLARVDFVEGIVLVAFMWVHCMGVCDWWPAKYLIAPHVGLSSSSLPSLYGFTLVIKFF